MIKYWGKRDVQNNIPSNSSVSLALPGLVTETTVEHCAFDEFYLNGNAFPIKTRMMLVIEEFRRRAKDSGGISIHSSNSFPHGCGLASSASGFAALVLALNDFYSAGLENSELSELARLGSGSASRSIFSGVVLFSGMSSRHVCFWPEIRILLVILVDEEKKVPSTEGMLRTADTSRLYRDRLERVEEKAVDMLRCISEKDFPRFAEMTMRESNELHAVMMDAYPPIRYIGDAGFEIMDRCHELNAHGTRVAYTFDAGPNPFLITLDEFADKVRMCFEEHRLVLCS